MTYLFPILMLLIGVALGAAAVWLWMRAKIEQVAERAGAGAIPMGAPAGPPAGS